MRRRTRRSGAPRRRLRSPAWRRCSSAKGCSTRWTPRAPAPPRGRRGAGRRRGGDRQDGARAGVRRAGAAAGRASSGAGATTSSCRARSARCATSPITAAPALREALRAGRRAELLEAIREELAREAADGVDRRGRPLGGRGVPRRADVPGAPHRGPARRWSCSRSATTSCGGPSAAARARRAAADGGAARARAAALARRGRGAGRRRPTSCTPPRAATRSSSPRRSPPAASCRRRSVRDAVLARAARLAPGGADDARARRGRAGRGRAVARARGQDDAPAGSPSARSAGCSRWRAASSGTATSSPAA